MQYKLSFYLNWKKMLLKYFLYLCESINNVGRMLLLGLAQKQNGSPIGHITLLLLISPLKRGVQHIWRLIYCLLMMAMIVGPLMDVKDPGKVRNWQVAKSRIVLVVILNLILVKSLFHDSSFMDVDTAL